MNVSPQMLEQDVSPAILGQLQSHPYSLPDLAKQTNRWITQSQYDKLMPIQKARFLTNVYHVNHKIENHNWKIQSNVLLYITHIFLRFISMGRYGLTWEQIAIDVHAKAKEIFQIQTSEERAQLMKDLPDIAQIKVVYGQSSGKTDTGIDQSFIYEYSQMESLIALVKKSLQDDLLQKENRRHYYRLLAIGQPLFNFYELDTDTYCQFLGDLASHPEWIEMKKNHAYSQLLFGLAKAIEEKGMEPLQNFFQIVQILVDKSKKIAEKVLLEDLNITSSPFRILKALALHPDTKSLFDSQHFFIRGLLQGAIQELTFSITTLQSKIDNPIPFPLPTHMKSIIPLVKARASHDLTIIPWSIEIFFIELRELKISKDCLMQYFDQFPSEKNFLLSLPTKYNIENKEDFDWFFS